MHQGLRDDNGLRILDWEIRRKECCTCRHFGGVRGCSIREDECATDIDGTLELSSLRNYDGHTYLNIHSQHSGLKLSITFLAGQPIPTTVH